MSVPVAVEVTRLILFWEGGDQLEPPHVGSYFSAACWRAATKRVRSSSYGRAAREDTRALFWSRIARGDLSVFIRAIRV